MRLSVTGVPVMVSYFAMENTWWNVVVILMAAFGTSSTQQDSAFAIPMLFPYNDCSATSSSLDYTFYFLHTEGRVASHTAYTTSAPNSPQIVFGKTFNHTWNWHFFELEHELLTPLYQCNNTVFGLYILFHNQPAISMISTLWSKDFAQAFSVLPQASYLELEGPNGTANLYHYYFLSGRHVDEDIIDGIAITVIADETNITMEFETDIVALRNAQESNHSNSSWILHDLHLFEVFWIHQKVKGQSCGNTTGGLRGTKITSTKPLSVFTTKLKCTEEFSYDSQVVHQMPSISEWGKEFIVDTQQINILPDQEDISYELHIRAAESNTNITIIHMEGNARSNTAYYSLEAEEELILTLTPTAYTHVHMEAMTPVLVLLDIHSLPSISYSTVVQPVEWFSNEQMIVLSHPQPDANYRYHISVVVTEKYFNTDEIIIVVEGVNKTSGPTTISRHQGFNGRVFSAGNYELFYIEMDSSTLNRSQNGTILVLKHTNPCGKLGVTVYTYADDLQYAYSNGFIIDSGTKVDDEACVTMVTSVDDTVDVRAATTVGVSVLLLVIITTIIITIVCLHRQYKRATTEPTLDYKFDVFLSFAEEDKNFVERNIHIPLEQRGYRAFWHYKHFQPGLTIMENIERAVNTSRRTVFICSKRFSESKFCLQEMTYCLDMQRKQKVRKVIPVVLEEEYCPKELRHFNQIRISREDMDEREVEEVIIKMKLGEHVKKSKCEDVTAESEV